MPCTHHLWDDPTGLCCTRDLGHAGGHTYSDSFGSFVPDKAGHRGSAAEDLDRAV